MSDVPKRADVGARAAVTPVAFTEVVVPLDGSDESARAIPVARQFAERFEADLTLIAVATHDSDRATLQRSVERAAIRAQAKSVVIEHDHAPDGILSAVDQRPGHLVCMASHGRGRAAGLVGSVAGELAARASDPLVLVGPRVPDDHRLTGRLVSCVDGSPWSESVLPAAAPWAAALGLGLSIVTVAEPVPEPVTPGASYHRRHGPDIAAEEYVGRLVSEWQGRGVDVDGEAVYDPVNVVDGLTRCLERRPPGLVAATTHARTGMARLVLGSVAARIVHEIAAPILLVPGASR